MPARAPSRLALLIYGWLLASGGGAAAFGESETKPRVTDAKILEGIQEDLEKKRARKDRNLPYAAQILMRPRGCSFDGRWAVFEKRRISDHTEISLVLFDMARFIRTEFLLPSFDARQKAVRDPGVDGPAIPSNAMEHRFDQSVLGVDTEFESSTGSIYRFNLEKQLDRVRLQVWLTLRADRGGDGGETDLERRRLLADYSVMTPRVSVANVPEVYSFNDGHSVAVKLHLVRVGEANKPVVEEDVLCFDDTRVAHDTNLVLWRKSGYTLSPLQRKHVFLTHQTIDWELGFVERRRYLLGGEFRVSTSLAGGK